MKKMLFLLGGFCAAAVGFLVLGTRRVPTVTTMARSLENAWADHHTIA